jgi:3-oxoacyl-[acyl-carrier-protein] synthase III
VPLRTLFRRTSCLRVIKSSEHHGGRALQIAGISLQVPTLRLTNADVISRISVANSGLDRAVVDHYCAIVRKLLCRSGAVTRYVRDKSHGETSIGLILRAVSEALLKANMSPEDVDLVIFCGVGRGFLEPSNAAFVCRALGMNCDHFDISDACMSWVRALHIADNFLRASSYAHILIVNGEFMTYELGNEHILLASDPARLRYTFSAYTIGEAATATVVVAGEAQWNFQFRSDTSLSPLCTVPLVGFEEISGPDPRIGLNGHGGFASFGDELFAAALTAMVKFIKETYADVGSIDVWFPHAASAKLNAAAADQLGISDKLYGRVFAEYGNIISASVPAAIALALQDGTLSKGRRFVLCPASAGMSVALVEGTY